MSEYPEKPADLVESAEESLVEEKKSVEAGVVELDVEREMRRLSRRSFLSGAAAATAGVGGWRWLATRREDDGIAWPLRRAHEINEQLARDYFRGTRRPATRSGRPSDPRREPEDLVGYVSLETEDGGYYVGLDMESALHPQTLLCYEMNGKPLTAPHGAPLRLAIPVKYGIKNIKRIGTIRFTDRRPPDYWAERGYDWYAGH